MREIILGFDSSSNTIGYCVLAVENDKIEFIETNYIKPIKDGDITYRIAHTRDLINQIILKHNPTKIAIEDIIKFMKFSTASTVIMLATFNRMICLCAYDILNKPPSLLNVNSIRTSLKKSANLEKNPKKEEIPNVLEKLLNFKFPWVYTRTNKRNNIPRVKEESYDMSDAIACAYCEASKLITQIVKPKGKKK